MGGSSLERLEKIKDDIDPNGMLNCNACVGNNKPRNKYPEENGSVFAEENGYVSAALGMVDTSGLVMMIFAVGIVSVLLTKLM